MPKRPFALFLSALLFLYFPIELIWKSHKSLEIHTIDIILSGIIPLVLLVFLIRVTKIGWYTLIAMIAL